MSDGNSEDTSPTLESLGLYLLPEGDELTQDLFADSLIEVQPISSDDINDDFSNINDLAWLEEAARENRCVLAGESHYGRYVENLKNRILFALNTYDHYHLMVQELQYSLTPFVNYYLDLEDESEAESYLAEVLRPKLFCEEFLTRIRYIRRWNQTHPERLIHVGFSDIEHDYKTTLSEIVLPYLRQAVPDIEIDVDNLQAFDINNHIPEFREALEIARAADLIGEYPFITPDYIETVIDNLESTWLAKLDRILFVYYRQKAIIRNLTDPDFLGRYFEEGKVYISGGFYHTEIGFDYPLDANFMREGSYLTYEYEPTQGKTYSIVLSGYAFTLDAMAEIDPATCGHQGSGYKYIVGAMREAHEAGLITPDDRVVFSEPDTFGRYQISTTDNSQPALLRNVDMDTILDIALETEQSLYNGIRQGFAWLYTNNDAYILVPYSPVVTAIQQDTDE